MRDVYFTNHEASGEDLYWRDIHQALVKDREGIPSARKSTDQPNHNPPVVPSDGNSTYTP